MTTSYIIDNSVLSHYIWAKILGADSHEYKDKVVISCSESPEISDKSMYLCTIDDGRFTVKETVLSDGEIRVLSQLALNIQRFQKDGRKNIILTLNPKHVNEFGKEAREVIDICSKNSCYVPPEIPVAFVGGNINNIFTLSLNSKEVKYVPNNIEFNKYLMDFFEKTRSKVLLDPDLLDNLGDTVKQYLKENLKALFKEEYDKYVYEDKKNIFYPIYKISDGKNTLIYDPKNMLLRFNNKVIPLSEKVLSNHPALQKVLEIVKEAPYDINRVREALKTLQYSNISDGIIKSIRKFDPRKSYIDAYLISVAHDDTIVVTSDKDIKGFHAEALPPSLSNIKFV